MLNLAIHAEDIVERFNDFAFSLDRQRRKSPNKKPFLRFRITVLRSIQPRGLKIVRFKWLQERMQGRTDNNQFVGTEADFMDLFDYIQWQNAIYQVKTQADILILKGYEARGSFLDVLRWDLNFVGELVDKLLGEACFTNTCCYALSYRWC